MRIVSWNVRGLNGLEKRKEVKELVREKSIYGGVRMFDYDLGYFGGGGLDVLLRKPFSDDSWQVLDEFVSFNEFIEECVLVDLPLCGRKFTWFKGDGRSMSRLDRFVLSEGWCLLWPNSMQVAHLRVLSDHCPIVLSVDEEN
ncbi:hypothetical protein MTR_6g048650 [Medicago truncatula]|uniref:Endonuclease/exonuclease/phosphatase family protein n=1 Tax=Medicago truncatula TaxID=3880 RepID=A0A072UKA1_MEDTR|nr:hypothetical protein MTR_6g048650 [Medicago truncatula]